MKKVFSLKTVLFLSLICIFVFLYYLYYNPLKNLGINSSFLETFSINDISSAPLKNNKITFLYLSRKKGGINTLKEKREKITIKVIHALNPEEAVKKIKTQSALIESVFHPKPAPYFAILTKEISCSKEFLPILRKKDWIWRSWTMFANKRQGFGVCDKKEVFFINHKLLKYCLRKRVLLEIDYFNPVHLTEKLPELNKIPLLLENMISCSE